MDITGLGINIGYFFDLIVGGLIALGLALRGLSLDAMFQEFTDICENTFFRPLDQIVKKIGFAFNWYDSLYSTEYLRSRVKEIMSIEGKDLSMFGSPIQTGKQPITHVGVTIVKKGEIASTITNYNRTVPEQRLDFEREDNDDQELAAWEASWVRNIIQAFLQNLDGEVVWEEFKQNKGAEKYDTKTHHRLNANLPIKRCKLDDVRQLKLLRKGTERYFDPMTLNGGYRYLHSVAHRLLAKLFFFQPTSRVRHDRGKGASLTHLPGVIRCRLDNHSTEVKTLVTKIAYFFSSNQDSLLDAVNENNKLPFNQDTVKMVRGYDAIFEVDHIITISNGKSWQAVYVRFNDDREYYPTSGFPCRMDDLLSRVGEDKYQDTELPYPMAKPTKPMRSNQAAWHEPNSESRHTQGALTQNPGTVLPRSREPNHQGMAAHRDARGEEVYREENICK
ncbi:uncharacterized protein DFL_005486 [Arthrobotrys flagrans]|uniref:Uncharacterized protein n=1 Tax=Arthrobotrys flagrans TaxID=97331 RepID=A0A436ZXI6_ARTFL|nr:hypothetical protein DFL_005486 [Arthrobotrys flagrans]